MLTYILIFFSCLFLLTMQAFLKRRDKKFFLFIVLVILAFVSGTRYQMGGSDFIVYKAAYDSIPTLTSFFSDYSNLDQRYMTFGFERGYLFITSFLKTLGFNFYGFCLVHALFFYFCLYQFIKRNSYSYLIIVSIFLYKLFFYNTFISMRQSITLAIFLLAIEFIKNKKFMPYVLTILVATTFHSAAIVLLPLYFINKIKFTPKRIVLLNVLFIPTLVLSFLNISLLSFAPILFSWLPSATVVGKIQSYAESGMESRIGLLHIAEYFFLMAIVYFNFNKIKQFQHSNLFIGFFLCLLPIFTLFSGYEILTRFKDYFIISYAILLGMVFAGQGKYSIAAKVLIFIICMLGVFRFMLLFDDGAFADYRSILIEGISIFGEVQE